MLAFLPYLDTRGWRFHLYGEISFRSPLLNESQESNPTRSVPRTIIGTELRCSVAFARAATGPGQFRLRSSCKRRLSHRQRGNNWYLNWFSLKIYVSRYIYFCTKGTNPIHGSSCVTESKLKSAIMSLNKYFNVLFFTSWLAKINNFSTNLGAAQHCAGIVYLDSGLLTCHTLIFKRYAALRKIFSTYFYSHYEPLIVILLTEHLKC